MFDINKSLFVRFIFKNITDHLNDVWIFTSLSKICSVYMSHHSANLHMFRYICNVIVLPRTCSILSLGGCLSVTIVFLLLCA